MPGPHYAEGVYAAQIMQVAFAESSNGNPMIQFRVKIIGQIDVGGNVVAGRDQYDRTVRLTLTEKSGEMCIKKLRWAGWAGTDFKSVSSMVNSMCRFVCDHDTIKNGDRAGELTESWDFELPPLESKELENDPAVEKKLNTLFGKTLKGIAPKDTAAIPENKRQPEPEPAAAGVAPLDDETPF